MKKLLIFICMSVLRSVTFAQWGDFSEFSIFRDEVLENVYDNEEYLPLMDMNQAKQDLVELTRSYDEVLSSVNDLDQRKESTDNSYQKAKISANTTLQNMKETQELLLKRQTQVTISLNSIAWLDDWLWLLSQDIELAKKQISTYSKFLFKTINDYYLSDQEISSIKLLTKSDNISRSLSKQELSQMLYASLQQWFDQMNDLHQQYEEKIHTLQSTIAGYHEQIDLYRTDLRYLEQQREHVDQLLDFLEKDKAYIDQQIQRFTESQKDLEYQIDRIDTITQKTDNFLSQNVWVRNLLEDNDKEDGPQYFSRPVRVPNGLNDAIAADQYAWSSWITLQAQHEEEIYAPAPGIVYKVYESADAGLSRMILLHKYGYSTVILPLSEVFVHQWALVKRGEILWLAWGKPWTTWAWWESTWAHAYFEVLRNGKRIDPFLVMDLSVYQSIHDLDEQYHLKRKQDYLSRTIDLSNLPKLKGDTAWERRDYFLSKSGNSIFSDPWLRVSAAQWTWIDPTFGICIGAAETSYRNFKSGNNIGNVGNNDRGDTVQYTAPIDWVRAIFQTLGNKYLGEYHSMNQLSRYGNKTWSIYASDPINRQKNIQRCLSMIYEVNIPEDYFMRIK